MFVVVRKKKDGVLVFFQSVTTEMQKENVMKIFKDDTSVNVTIEELMPL